MTSELPLMTSRRARHRFIGDRGTTARAIFDDDGRTIGLVDLLAKESRENVGTAARRERDHDPDRSCRLVPSALIGERQEDKGKGGSASYQMQKSMAGKVHDAPHDTKDIPIPVPQNAL